nr:class II aldolase/adducin family protein [Methylonatrum kenyense]
MGFGNVSCRRGSGFIISGTQTGERESLAVDGYCQVTDCDPTVNRVEASGPVRPSSEALTHGAVYRARPQAGCVLHGHSSEIWQRATNLGLAVTDAAVTYGTPAMAAEVARLLDAAGMADSGVFAMGGHEDGVIAFGPDEDTAGGLLVAALACALTA